MKNEHWISQSDKRKSFFFRARVFCCLIVISILFPAIFSSSVYGQIYNYSPISYGDFETNPSYLATSQMNNRVQVSHQNSFNASKAFSSTNLKYSAYFPSAFIGVGASLSSTKIANNIQENHVGIGIAYRNVLLNKLYVKIGAMYKLSGTNSGSGTFDYYSFTPDNISLGGTLQHNLNTSLTFNTEQDEFFLSVGVSNIDLPISTSMGRVEFPTYYSLHLGNLMALFKRPTGSEISYSGFIKKIDAMVSFNHYATFKFRYKLDRKSALEYGSKIGYVENSYFHFIPFITYLRQKFRVNVSYNFHSDKKTFQPVYFESFQCRLILTL